MIPEDTLAAFLNDALEAKACEGVVAELARDPDALDFVLQQRQIDQALHSLLAPSSLKQHLRDSIRAATAGMPRAQLRAQVRAETVRGRHAARGPVPVRTEQPGSRSRWFQALDRLLIPWTPRRLAFAFGLTLATLAACWALFRPGSTRRLEVGQFAQFIGQPTVRTSSGAGGTQAVLGTPVHLGDLIETGDADRAEIRFRDGTTLRLAFNTSIELPLARHPQPPDTNALLRPPEVRLLKGQLWTKVAKLTNAPTYAIRTDAATAIARGTEFGVKLKHTASGATNRASAIHPASAAAFAAMLTVKQGTVDFTNAHGSVRATAMTESTATAGSAPTEPRRLSRLVAERLVGPGPWVIRTAPLSTTEAAHRLAGGGGWAGFQAADFPETSASRGTVVCISGVVAGSPAANSGLMADDVVVALDGRPVGAALSLGEAVLLRPEGPMALGIRRGDLVQDLALKPAHRVGLVPGPVLGENDRIALAAATEVLQATGESTTKARTGPTPTGPLDAAIENNRGVLREIRDELGPAIRAYGRAARAQPGVALYRYNLGLALRKIGSRERAMQELEKAVQLAPGSSPVRAAHAEMLALEGRDDDALSLAEAALADDPTWHGLWELKAQILAKQRRYPEALAAAEVALKQEPDCVVAHSYLGGILRSMDRLPEAVAALRKALKIDPSQASLHLDLGDLLLAVGEYERAEACFLRAVELNPGLAPAHRGLGDILADRGQAAKAEGAYRRAIESDPDDPESYCHLADLYRDPLRQPSAAGDIYRCALRLDPDHVGAHSGLGVLAAMRGDFAGAEHLLRRAAELDPRSAGIRGNLAEVLRHQGRLDEALVEFRRAIELDPDNTRNLNNLAILHASQREFLEAERLWRAVLDRRSGQDRISALRSLAHVCTELQRPAETEGLLREALALGPEHPPTCNQLAWFLATQGTRLDEALELARRAVDGQPDNPASLDTLGWVQFQRGELDAARITLQQALHLADDQPVAREIRAHLETLEARIRGQP